MRGKALFEKAEPQAEGITPAYAGKRQKSSIRISAYRDHPRLCGEKLVVCLVLIGFYRITPAYAGKRLVSEIDSSATGDHPRLCGEKATRQRT